MNLTQDVFYRQAQSDWAVSRHFHSQAAALRVIRRSGRRLVVKGKAISFPPCHELHYLQMSTEKLAKAYYQTPPRGHAAFRQFLRDLMTNPLARAPLGFRDLSALTRWEGSVRRIVGAIEDLAPQLADKKGLPNPEYPWPRGAEAFAPVGYPFQVEIFSLLKRQAVGGEPPFLTILDRMFASMRTAGWHL